MCQHKRSLAGGGREASHTNSEVTFLGSLSKFVSLLLLGLGGGASAGGGLAKQTEKTFWGIPF